MNVLFLGWISAGVTLVFRHHGNQWKFKVDTLPETNSHFCSQLSKNWLSSFVLSRRRSTLTFFVGDVKVNKRKGQLQFSWSVDKLDCSKLSKSQQKKNVKKKRMKSRHEGIWMKKQVTLVWHVNNIFNPSKLQSFEDVCDLKKTQFQPISTHQNLSLKKKDFPQIPFLKSSSSNQKISPDSLQRSLSFVQTESSKLGCPKHAMVPDLFGSAVSALGNKQIGG